MVIQNKRGRKNTNPQAQWENIRIDRKTKLRLMQKKLNMDLLTYDQVIIVLLDVYERPEGGR